MGKILDSQPGLGCIFREKKGRYRNMKIGEAAKETGKIREGTTKYAEESTE